LSVVFLGNDAAALLVLANGSALLFGGLVYRLTRSETGNPHTATRAAWFAAIFPPAMALVLGYAEATFMLLSVAMFLALRTRRFAWAIPFGVLAGLTRPVGVLLVVPAVIEAARAWRASSLRDRAARVAAVVAAPVGSGLYFLWVRYAYGDAFLPLSIQNNRAHRGGFVDPFTRTYDGISDLVHGDRFGSGLHILWLALFVALIVVLFRRLPSSYGWYAAAMVLVNVSARNLDSFERYAMSAFPLVLAVALVTDRPDVERPVLTLSAAGLVGYSVLAFLGVYVP
jgi:Gpi18-like mannosyltransferase